MRKRYTFPALSLVCLMLVGCGTFHEQHFFQVKDPASGRTNYFRVSITGSSGLSRARYVSGYYDERAVDLYFNEVTPVSQTSETEIKPLFVKDLKDPGTDETINIFEPGKHGALLILLSTNPNAVADTIGQFAESQQTADALTNLLNHSDVRELEQKQATQTKANAALGGVASELDSILGALPTSANAAVGDAAKIRAGYLQALSNIAITMGGDGKFATFADAAAWFQARRSLLRSQP